MQWSTAKWNWQTDKEFLRRKGFESFTYFCMFFVAHHLFRHLQHLMIHRLFNIWFSSRVKTLTYDFADKKIDQKRGGDLHVNLDRWLHKFNFSNSAHLWVQTVKHCHVPGIHHKWYKFVLPWHVLRWFCSTWVANWAYIGPRWGNGYCFVKANIKLGSSGWLWGLYTWLQHWNYGEWTD